MTELQLTISSDNNITALVVSDKACSNSWVSNIVAGRLGL